MTYPPPPPNQYLSKMAELEKGQDCFPLQYCTDLQYCVQRNSVIK